MGFVTFDSSQDPTSIQINSSVSTVFAMVNSMVGGIILVLPFMVMNSGIIPSIIIMGIAGGISCKTFQILMGQLEPQEFDCQEIIQRIMGKNWMKFFNTLASFYLFLICILYYYLIIASMYSVSVFFIPKITGNDNCCAHAKEITLSQFSTSWLSIILVLPVTGLLFIKDFKYLIKLSEMGIYAIYSYVIFIFYLYFTNMDKIMDYWDNKYLYKFERGDLIASSLLGFQIQSTSIPIMKFNRNQNKNTRDVNLTFFLAIILYLIIGLLGGLSSLVLAKGDLSGTDTILELFNKKEITPVLIECLYLGHLVSVYPIFWQLVKSRIYEITFSVDRKPSKYTDAAVNIFFVIFVTLLRNIPSINVDTITGINGAFSCFFMVIFIPICLDIMTYKSDSCIIQSVRSLIVYFGFNPYYERDYQMDMDRLTDRSVIRDRDSNLMSENMKRQEELEFEMKRKNYTTKMILNCFIFIIGLFCMFYGLYISFAEVLQREQMLQHSMNSNHTVVQGHVH